MLDAVQYEMQAALIAGLWLLGPPLLVALFIGLIIGLVQAMTSVQEQTLSFVPKLVGVALVYLFGGTWMWQILMNYTTEVFIRMVALGQQ
jgi:flagellar biosynthetic protein FliQ